jgi:hypothetical protein
MENRSALIDPRKGDIVEAVVSGKSVRRKVVEAENGNIVYKPSTQIFTSTCCISTWRQWCRKYEAVEVSE